MTFLPDHRLQHLRELVDAPDLTGTPYRLVRRLAAGGMATVFLVHDSRFERDVALKVLTIPDDAGTLVERMLREARIVAQLEHPGIVPIHDVGQLPDGRVFYTMKFVDGATLEDVRKPATPTSELLRNLLRVCETISFAHSRGVLHRDLKPSNIMVGAFGEILVMDWGIARPAQNQTLLTSQPTRAGDIHDTAHGDIIGTPTYMSPEQALGDQSAIDQRTDVYGLGAVLYFILTGSPPVQGSHSAEVLDRVRSGTIVPPRDRNRHVPRQLEAICLKALSTDHARRYPSADDFARDLTCYLDGQSVSAYRERSWEKAGRWLARNQLVVILVLVYLVARMIIILWRGI